MGEKGMKNTIFYERGTKIVGFEGSQAVPVRPSGKYRLEKRSIV
jgi:hypothetical protein